MFECKTTLKASHIAEAAEAARAVRELSGARSGTPYRELVSPPIFGVLAHSHAWIKKGSTPRENVDNALSAAALEVAHPRELIDLVCVAGLGCWSLTVLTYLGRAAIGDSWSELRPSYGLPEEGGCMSSYSRWDPQSVEPEPNPVAVLIALLFQRLAWANAAMRPLADYFRLAGLWGASQGQTSPWPVNAVFTPEVSSRLQMGASVNGEGWNEWSVTLP